MELIYYLIFLDRDKMNVYRDKSIKVLEILGRSWDWSILEKIQIL